MQALSTLVLWSLSKSDYSMHVTLGTLISVTPLSHGTWRQFFVGRVKELSVLRNQYPSWAIWGCNYWCSIFTTVFRLLYSCLHFECNLVQVRKMVYKKKMWLFLFLNRMYRTQKIKVKNIRIYNRTLLFISIFFERSGILSLMSQRDINLWVNLKTKQTPSLTPPNYHIYIPSILLQSYINDLYYRAIRFRQVFWTIL